MLVPPYSLLPVNQPVLRRRKLNWEAVYLPVQTRRNKLQVPFKHLALQPPFQIALLTSIKCSSVERRETTWRMMAWVIYLLSNLAWPILLVRREILVQADQLLEKLELETPGRM